MIAVISPFLISISISFKTNGSFSEDCSSALSFSSSLPSSLEFSSSFFNCQENLALFLIVIAFLSSYSLLVYSSSSSALKNLLESLRRKK